MFRIDWPNNKKDAASRELSNDMRITQIEGKPRKLWSKIWPIY